MATHINIKIGEESFIAELLWDDAPETVEKTLAVLPLGGKFWHSGWMGMLVFLPLMTFPVKKWLTWNRKIKQCMAAEVMYSGFLVNQVQVSLMVKEITCLSYIE
jgi:hypothetical protein